ncbi:MAG: Brp/Blh family beta-carotene 15,15'-dioxygenase [Planctomycetota bacterium]
MTTVDTLQHQDARSWLEPTLNTYTWSAAAATLLFAAAMLAISLNEATSAIIMLAAVLLVGVPHGAYDMEVGRQLLRQRFRRAWWIVFGGLYVASTILAGLFWIAAPVAGLAALLIGGALHWGVDDLEFRTESLAQNLWLAFARGTIPVAMPLLFHPEETARIFGVLVQAETAWSTVQFIGAIAALIGAVGLVHQLLLAKAHNRDQAPRIIAEIMALAVWFAITEPILAFTLYFCFWHAVRHSLRSAAEIDPTDWSKALTGYVRAVLTPTILTVLLAALAFVLLRGSFTATEGVWRTTFIGLFALTVPHVVLEIVASKSHTIQSGNGSQLERSERS